MTRPCSWPIDVRIERGDAGDYDRLARWHYRAGRPAVIAGVWRARVDGTHAGVLVVSRPTLNASWRASAWPEHFGASEARDARARRVDRLVRTIARVVVEPRFRGLGVASSLVRAYLSRPLTPLTESVAAMGRFAPIFEGAGMRRVEIEPARADRALQRSLDTLGVKAWRLLTPGWPRSLAPALLAWSRAGRGHARGKPLEQIASLAGTRLSSPRAAWVTG